METVLVHTLQKGEKGRAAFEITFDANNKPMAAVVTAGNTTKMVALKPGKLRKVSRRKYQYIYDDFLNLDYTDQIAGLSLEDGWYRLVSMIRHRGQNKMATLPLQVINGTLRVVTEWMVKFDVNDKQVKSSIQIGPHHLQRVSPQWGGDYMYQGQLILPDEIDLEELGA